MILCTSDRCFFFYFILSISNVSGNGIILVWIFFSLEFMNSLKGSHELPKFGQPCLCAFFWTEIHSFHPILKKLCEHPQKRLRTTYFSNELIPSDSQQLVKTGSQKDCLIILCWFCNICILHQ